MNSVENVREASDHADEDHEELRHGRRTVNDKTSDLAEILELRQVDKDEPGPHEESCKAFDLPELTMDNEVIASRHHIVLNYETEHD